MKLPEKRFKLKIEPAMMRTDEKTKEIFSFIAKIHNMKRTEFLRELASYLLAVYGTLESAITSYSIIGNSLTLEVSGKSRIVSGTFSMPTEASSSEVDAEVRKHVEKEFEELKRIE